MSKKRIAAISTFVVAVVTALGTLLSQCPDETRQGETVPAQKDAGP